MTANWLSKRPMSEPQEEQISNMAQIVETKIKKKSKSDMPFEWAKSELDAKKGTRTRDSLILELALRLEEEGEIETGRISTEIAKRLRKYVTQRYINKVLDEKYKDVKHVETRELDQTCEELAKKQADLDMI